VVLLNGGWAKPESHKINSQAELYLLLRAHHGCDFQNSGALLAVL
jgi:hypothetical protein